MKFGILPSVQLHESSKHFDRTHRGIEGLGDYDKNDPRFNHHPTNPSFLLKRIEELESDRDKMIQKLKKIYQVLLLEERE